jgi:hypothetical protein
VSRELSPQIFLGKKVDDTFEVCGQNGLNIRGV